MKEKKKSASKNSKTPKTHKKVFPYQVDLVDQYQGHHEYGYDTVGKYQTLEEAITVARQITEKALLASGSIYNWHGMGDAGLVYHNYELVWSGILEYTHSGGSKETLNALKFAIAAHRSQLRKGSQIPYIFHPIGVAGILTQHNCTDKLVSAGFLHDTIEDTSVTYEDLYREFGFYIAELVKGLSEPNREDSWENRKTHKLEYLKTAPLDVLLVSCADKLDNIRSIRRDEASTFGYGFWERFNAPRKKQQWYYFSLCDLFKDAAKRNPKMLLMVDDFEKEVSMVFK